MTVSYYKVEVRAPKCLGWTGAVFGHKFMALRRGAVVHDNCLRCGCPKGVIYRVSAATEIEETT